MPNIDAPRLCGGTFFLQLLRAKKPPTRTKAEGLRGEKDSVNNQRILEALIHFFDPKFSPTCDNTFKGDVSAYLSCNKSKGTNLPFTEKYCEDKVPKFDSIIKNNYNAPLLLMVEFIDKYINTDDIRKVVCALLQTIIDDASIDDDQLFFMGEMGNLSKEDLKGEPDVTLECFLLGIWHFILVNRQDNCIGKATFEAWHEEEGPGKPRIYVSDIGSEIGDIQIRRSSGVEISNEKTKAKGEEYIEEDTEEYVSDEYVSSALHAYQTLFQQITINNFNGMPGSTQIQNNNGVIIVGGTALPGKPIIDKTDYYHLVVGYEYGKRVIIHKDRAFTEYISDDVKRTFSLAAPEDMAMIPVLIMPEINDESHGQCAITGTVTKVKTQDNGVVLYVQKGLSFSTNIVKDKMSLFGINHEFELNRTHWTIKKINLQEAMEDAGIR